MKAILKKKSKSTFFTQSLRNSILGRSRGVNKMLRRFRNSEELRSHFEKFLSRFNLELQQKIHFIQVVKFNTALRIGDK